MKFRKSTKALLQVALAWIGVMAGCERGWAQEPLPPLPERNVVSIATLDDVATERGPNEAPDPAVFRISRKGPTDFDLRVQIGFYCPVCLFPQANSENGVDFPKIPEFVVIPAGSDHVDLSIQPTPDGLAEGSEPLVVWLEDIACIAIFPPPRECYEVGANRLGMARVLDSISTPGLPLVRLETIQNTTAEPLYCDGTVDFCPPGAPPAPMIARLWRKGGKLEQPLRVPMLLSGFASPGFDYSHSMEERGGAYFVTFGAGQEFVDIEFIPLADRLLERPESVILQITQELTATPPTYEIDAGQFRFEGVISDSIPFSNVNVVSVEAIDAEATEPTADGKADVAVFRFSRTGRIDFDLPVRFGFYCPVCKFAIPSAENGVDFEKVPNEIIIPAGKTFADLVIQPIADKALEGGEPLPVWIEEPACIEIFPAPKECYQVGDRRLALATLNDGGPIGGEQYSKLVILDPQSGAVFSGGDSILFVAYTVDTRGTFTQLEWYANDVKIGESQVVFIQAPTPGEPLTHEFTWQKAPLGTHVVTARAKDASGREAVSPPVRVTVVEPMKQVVVEVAATDPMAVEGTLADGSVDTASFTIYRRGGPVDVDVVVYYTMRGDAQNGKDYTELSGKVLLPAGEKSVALKVAPIVDADGEGKESVILQLESPICDLKFPPSPECYVVGLGGMAEAVIVDADIVVPVGPGHVVRQLPPGFVPGQPFRVELHLKPNPGTSAVGCEEIVPSGWKVTEISDGGVLDPITGVLRFGVFIGEGGRVVSYVAHPPTAVEDVVVFKGLASMDGSTLEVEGDAKIAVVAPPDAEAGSGVRFVHLGRAEGGGIGKILIAADKAGATYQVEVSDDLRTWKPLRQVKPGPDGLLNVLADPSEGNAPKRFYRLAPAAVPAAAP